MSPKLHRTLKNLFRVFLILFGNALYSLAIVAFILPSGIITGGTTGLALASAHWFHTPITAFVLCFNILTFLLGLFVLGWKFAATTLLSTFFYPILLAFASKKFKKTTFGCSAADRRARRFAPKAQSPLWTPCCSASEFHPLKGTCPSAAPRSCCTPQLRQARGSP